LYGALFMAVFYGMYFGKIAGRWPVAVTAMHAHEMVYGYGLAVVAGFLLTAVRNWTRMQTADGRLLMVMSGAWVAGRLPLLLPQVAYLGAVGDVLFGGLLLLSVAMPLYRRQLYGQWPVVLIVLVLWWLHVVYYLSLMGLTTLAPMQVVRISLYVLLNLLFIFSRRLIPTFIGAGLGQAGQLRNRRWVDRLLIPLFLVYAVNELFIGQIQLTSYLAFILLVGNGIRLWDWYRPGIWRKHLLWSLYVGYLFLTMGFALRLYAAYDGADPRLALHAMTVGGLGLISVSMMARVSLGHSGLSVFEERPGLGWIFTGVVLSAIFRALVPAIDASLYLNALPVAMWLWVAAFLGFVALYVKIFFQNNR